MTRWLVLASCLLGLEPSAHAIMDTCRYDGWSVEPGATLPPHARVIFYMDSGRHPPRQLNATLDGKVVPTKIAWTSAPPFVLATVEIDSSRTGKLKLAWGIDPTTYVVRTTASYSIASHVALPTAIHGKLDRFHRAYSHTSVHESWDGLAVAVDTTVIAFKVHWRRDDKDPWQDLVVPGDTLDIPNTLHLGEISCTENFSVPMLEHGIDLEVAAELPDGTWLPVAGVPAHYQLPALAPGTPISRP